MSVDIKQSKRTIAPFDGEKYSIWKYRVRALIAEEDALCVLDKDRPEKRMILGSKVNVLLRTLSLPT